MSYFVNVDTEKKVLTIDDSIKPTSRDQFLIDTYVKAGYSMRFKSEARTKRAKERADKEPKIAEIEEILKPFEDLTEKFMEIKKGKGKGKGAFAAKAWFKNVASEEIETRTKAAKEKKEK